MTDTYLQRRQQMLNPQTRTDTQPDGSPAPTGYYPDRSNPQQGQVSVSPVFDGLYRDRGTIGAFTNERIDQHPYLQVSANWTPPPAGPRRDGRDDPLTAGPPAPTPRIVDLWFRRTSGNSISRLADVPGHTFPKNGSQDGASTTWYVSTQASMTPYDPTRLVPYQGGELGMPDTLRQIAPSPPHGWTAQPVFNVKATENRKATELIQQQRGKADRLAPSTYAGQSFSNRTAQVSNPAGAAPVPSRRSRG